MNSPVAIVAAHPDDEVLGCGGTIARFVKEGHPVHILLMADGESSREDIPEKANSERVIDRNNAAVRAGKLLGLTSIEQLSLPDNRMDDLAMLDIVKSIEAFFKKYSPKSVFTHHSGDVNIDHRIIHDAVIAASRPQPGFSVKELLFFEVPSSTEWRPPSSSTMFNPNWFVDISHTLELKLQALRSYKDELRSYPHPRSLEATEALARWRGATIGVRAAEAFILGRKLI